MRKIEFIAPVAAMRGNLSGKQSLVYAENDNPAFDAPDGRQYARNYGPRFIGAKRSSDGKTYFAVKTKSAVNMSPAFRKQNALLAASSEIANIVSTNLSLIEGLTARYKQTAPEGWSFKRWLMSVIRNGLKDKRHFAFSGTTLAALFVKNPYIGTVAPSTATDIINQYPKRLLAKFWAELSDGYVLNVDGRKIIASDTLLRDVKTIVDNPRYNVAPVGIVTGGVVLPDDIEPFKDAEGIWGKPCVIGASEVRPGETYSVMYIIIEGQKYALGSLVGLDPSLEIFTTTCEATES